MRLIARFIGRLVDIYSGILDGDSHRLRRPLAILAALSLLLAIPACEGDSSSNGGSGNNGNNGNGNGGNGGPPGAPTSLAATTAADDQIDLSWEAPADNGGSDIGGYRIEYRQGNGGWIDAEADTESADTAYEHTGLTADTEYSYRVSAINANGTGPASNVAMATTATDAPTYDYICFNGIAAPGATSQQDTVKCESCGSGFALNSEMCEIDSDGDNMPDSIDTDDDNDGEDDTTDVDDDNDGLIEIASRAELDNMRHNLAGSSYDDEADDDGAGDGGDTTGAATTEPTNCSDGDSNTTISLCGYELANDIDLGGTTSTNNGDISCASNAWIPIGGCGSDGTCGETDDPTTPETETNDDDPFTAIFEGNGHTISNLCIEGNTTDIDVLGLFGHLGDATVRNLAIAGLYIESSFTGGDTDNNDDNSRIGGLAGYVTGDTAILNVAAEDSDSDIDIQGATTDAFQYIGGLVGRQDRGSITASFATGNVAGGDGDSDRVGGLVGYQLAGSITASFATGDVDGGDGGLRPGWWPGGLSACR